MIEPRVSQNRGLVPATFALVADVSPAQLTGNQADYNPSGWPTASTLRIDTDATLRYITGLAGGVDGRIAIITNIGANQLGISTLDGTSAAGNQFKLPSSDNLFLDANGSAMFRYDATLSKWIMIGFSMTRAGQAAMEATTSYYSIVTPNQQHFHPGHPKCWGEFNITGGVITSYNITSVADTAVGAVTVTIGTDFSSANWGCQVSRAEDDLTLVYSATYDAKAAGTVILRSAVEAGSGSDPSSASGNASWSFLGSGDL